MFRGDRLVFRDVGFSLQPGRALLLKGANGAGKSTLLRVVAGLATAAAGTLRWGDAPALEDPCVHAGRIAWMGHKDGIKAALTVLQNVPDRDALVAMGLGNHAALPALLLSAGQKRRLAMARVIAARRPLWLLDEPATGMDAASVARLEAACAAQLAAGGMIIAATHTPLALPGDEVLAL